VEVREQGVWQVVPFWLRHFHLCDAEKPQVRALRALKADHVGLDITIYPGDFNRKVVDLRREAVESALHNLGFSSHEAQTGIESVDWNATTSTQEALAVALNALNRK